MAARGNVGAVDQPRHGKKGRRRTTREDDSGKVGPTGSARADAAAHVEGPPGPSPWPPWMKNYHIPDRASCAFFQKGGLRDSCAGARTNKNRPHALTPRAGKKPRARPKMEVLALRRQISSGFFSPSKGKARHTARVDPPKAGGQGQAPPREHQAKFGPSTWVGGAISPWWNFPEFTLQARKIAPRWPGIVYHSSAGAPARPRKRPPRRPDHRVFECHGAEGPAAAPAGGKHGGGDWSRGWRGGWPTIPRKTSPLRKIASPAPTGWGKPTDARPPALFFIR